MPSFPNFFKDSPVVGVDLGAGLHSTLPLLNSPAFKDVDFKGKSEIGIPRDANLQLGLGVDTQARDPQWTIASFPPGGEEFLFV